MSSVQLTLTADDARLKANLRGLMALHGTGYQLAKEQIGVFMVGQIHDRFQDQKLVDGKAMPQSKAAAARSGQTLVAGGHLRDSYSYAVIKGVFKGGVELSSGKKYAAIHHFGGMTGRGRKTKIEARPVLGINDTDLKGIGRILVNNITASVNARGL